MTWIISGTKIKEVEGKEVFTHIPTFTIVAGSHEAASKKAEFILGVERTECVILIEIVKF